MQGKYLSDYLLKNVNQLGDEEFLICQDRNLSWREAYQLSQLVSAFITRKLGGEQQRIISVLLPDTWQFVVAYFGVTMSGNIAMPIDITFKKLEVNAVVRAASPALVIATKKTQVLVDGPVVFIEDILSGDLSPVKVEYQLPADKQIATLFLSSGTTGHPKAIPNTHANQLWDVAAISEPMGWTSKDTLLITLHLSHRHGLVICLLGAVFHGSKVYLEERFNAERLFELLESGKITIYSSVPAAYEKIVSYEPDKKFDLSRVRLFASSSSTLPPFLYDAFKKRFGHDILDRYGTSETGSISIRKRQDGATLGEPLNGVKIRIEKTGEIALKSPGLFPGYYKNPEATKESMTDDGWWLTGDVGEEREGQLILKGRSKDRINKSGYSIYPQDIEWAFQQNPNVGEVKVIGISAEKKLDDRVIAFFSGDTSEKELSEYAQLNLPRSWRPDIFIKIKSLPRTSNGKPSLVKLKQILAEDHAHLIRGE